MDQEIVCEIKQHYADCKDIFYEDNVDLGDEFIWRAWVKIRGLQHDIDIFRGPCINGIVYNFEKFMSIVHEKN